MSEKTEKPTDKKLNEARKDGNVPKSQDINGASVLLASAVLFTLFFKNILDYCSDFIGKGVSLASEDFNAVFMKAIINTVTGTLVVSIPFVLIVGVISVASSFFQTGFIFSMKSVTPDFNKVNPSEGIKKVFSFDNLVELIKSILKVTIVTWVLWIVLKDSLDPIIKIQYGTITTCIELTQKIISTLLWAVVLCFIAIAAADFAFQKYRHIEKLKMSKDDIKQEYKNSEGDPMVKGQRKQFAREISGS